MVLNKHQKEQWSLLDFGGQSLLWNTYFLKPVLCVYLPNRISLRFIFLEESLWGSNHLSEDIWFGFGKKATSVSRLGKWYILLVFPALPLLTLLFSLLSFGCHFSLSPSPSPFRCFKFLFVFFVLLFYSPSPECLPRVCLSVCSSRFFWDDCQLSHPGGCPGENQHLVRPESTNCSLRRWGAKA